jgi:putative protease
MSSKDLCALPLLKEYLETGINSFKIEGRMKSLHYIATIVKSYRQAIDEYNETGDIKNIDKYIAQIAKAENREKLVKFLKEESRNNEDIMQAASTIKDEEFDNILENIQNISDAIINKK